MINAICSLQHPSLYIHFRSKILLVKSPKLAPYSFAPKNAIHTVLVISIVTVASAYPLGASKTSQKITERQLMTSVTNALAGPVAVSSPHRKMVFRALRADLL